MDGSVDRVSEKEGRRAKALPRITNSSATAPMRQMAQQVKALPPRRLGRGTQCHGTLVEGSFQESVSFYLVIPGLTLRLSGLVEVA